MPLRNLNLFTAAASLLGLLSGCATSPTHEVIKQPVVTSPPDHIIEPSFRCRPDSESLPDEAEPIRQVDFNEELDDLIVDPDEHQLAVLLADGIVQKSSVVESTNGPAPDELGTLTAMAVERNPRLTRLYQDYQAAVARSRYADKLPDPKFGVNVFGNPIETASGSQRANLGLTQSIPWLHRLSAQEQQACFESLAIRSEYAAERLNVIAAVRVGWYRLYVIDKQIQTTKANEEFLGALIRVANGRIAAGTGSPGDIYLGTLELSKLQERLISLRKQRSAVQAEINRSIGREGEVEIASPDAITLSVIPMDADAIHQVALGSQPEIEAARIRTQATRWGIEVARLRRRPELMLSANYFITDDNRPATGIVNVGEDPWALGFQISVPVWHKKYDAMRNEAAWNHQAANQTVNELSDRYETLVLTLDAEAKRALETAELYASTILPQARQTLSADQESYSNGTVEFDRVIRDYRNLLTLELGYHQAVGELAIANARLRQVAGTDLTLSEVSDTSVSGE